MNPIDKYNKRVDAVNSLVCVGLDSEFSKLPDRFKSAEFPQFEFNKFIINATHEFVSTYKPNSAFYEARGEQGWHELKLTISFLRGQYPDIFTICDAKRGDIGSTNQGYVIAILDDMGFDAMTLHAYAGRQALKPFLDRTDKASIFWCRSSNPGAEEFQDLQSDGKPLWQIIAEHVSQEWNTNNNCMLVAGATYPEELKQIRGLVGDMTLLIPGIGAQGGDVEKTVKAGLNSSGKGMIISSSRGIIFADDPAMAAKKLRDEINQYR
jgi:orotidine-5'-phosphate decarboxylase